MQREPRRREGRLQIRGRVAFSERGSAMLLTAISMVVFIGFTALAVDGGYLHLRHAQLQDIADSAALAAASEMMSAPGGDEEKRQAAFDAVTRFAQRNGVETADASGYSADATFGDDSGRLTVSFAEGSREVTVRIAVDTRLFFAPVLSIGAMSVNVESAAEVIHHDGGQGGLLPLGFFGDSCIPGVEYAMTLSPGDGHSGNYGFLDYKPPCSFSEYLADGYPGTVTLGDLIETFPGVKTGQVRGAIGDRVNDCTHGCSVSDPDGVNDAQDTIVDVVEPCRRVVVIPRIGGFSEANGRSYVTVCGFVKFFIEGYNQSTKVLSGWCLGQVSPDEAGGGSSAACSVRLVK